MSNNYLTERCLE